jgi:hypothetical protein
MAVEAQSMPAPAAVPPSTPLPLPVATAPAPMPEPSAPTFELHEKERLIIRQMLAQDFDVFVKGGETIFGRSESAKEYVAVSADDFQKDYERNEVAGDKKYRGKRLALRGKVADIKRSIGENYFLTLRGGSNQFMRPTAKMADGYVDYLAGLEKGQDIELICNGDGMLMGSAVAIQCIPAEIWIDQMTSAKVLELPKLIGSDEITPMLMMAVLAADLLKDTSPCFSPAAKPGNKGCSADISQALEKAKAKKRGADPTPSEATKERLKAVPGAEAYLQRIKTAKDP